MRRTVQDRFERVIVEHYEPLKGDVLATVRGKLAVDNLHSDPSDLEAAYNAAWHALYERSRTHGEDVGNLGGWLATIAYRRAIDDVRRARRKYLAPVAVDESIRDLGYEHDVDAEIADRQRYHQWLMSVRLRLNPRERQAVSLCVLHEHSRRDASEIMGLDIKRLDKIMVEANKKLGGLLEAINRGDWCREQRSLIKAFALGLHEEGSERHELAAAHVMECHACAAYVRSMRGLAGVVPAPTLIASGAGAGGGIAGALSSWFGSGSGSTAAAGGAGTAAGGGGAALLSGIGAKTAALCVSAVCAVGGAAIVVESAPDAKRPADSASASRPAHRSSTAASTRTNTTKTTTRSSAQRASSSSKKRTPPSPNSQGAQEIAEFGIEPQATSKEPTSAARAASVPRPPAASEFGIEP